MVTSPGTTGTTEPAGTIMARSSNAAEPPRFDGATCPCDVDLLQPGVVGRVMIPAKLNADAWGVVNHSVEDAVRPKCRKD
jgi:hypothetical protein